MKADSTPAEGPTAVQNVEQGTIQQEETKSGSQAKKAIEDRDYESLLAETDKNLRDIEEKIWTIEVQYLNESQNIGNIFKGWSEDRQNIRSNQVDKRNTMNAGTVRTRRTVGSTAATNNVHSGPTALNADTRCIISHSSTTGMRSDAQVNGTHNNIHNTTPSFLYSNPTLNQPINKFTQQSLLNGSKAISKHAPRNNMHQRGDARLQKNRQAYPVMQAQPNQN